MKKLGRVALQCREVRKAKYRVASRKSGRRDAVLTRSRKWDTSPWIKRSYNNIKSYVIATDDRTMPSEEDVRMELAGRQVGKHACIAYLHSTTGLQPPRTTPGTLKGGGRDSEGAE